MFIKTHVVFNIELDEKYMNRIEKNTFIILGRSDCSVESFNFSSSEEIHASLVNSLDSRFRSATYFSIFSVCQVIGEMSKAQC